MDETILAILRCPRCGGNLGPEVRSPNGPDVALGCLRCPARYSVPGGIVDLMPAPSESVVREVEGLRRLEARILRDDGEPDPDTIRSLPWRYRIPKPHSYWSSPYWIVNTVNFEALLAALHLQGGETVLDLGASIGWTSTRLAQAGCHVLAVDISASRLTGLRGGEYFLTQGHRFERALFDFSGPYPVKDASVDIVVASAALHHSRSLLDSLREIHRVLKPGGRLAVANEATQGLFRDASRFGEDVADLEGEENVYVYRDWVRLLSRAGFSNWQLLFPRNLEMDFRGELAFGTSFSAIRKVTRAFWRVPALRRAIKRFALVPAHIVLGTQLSFVSAKGQRLP